MKYTNAIGTRRPKYKETPRRSLDHVHFNGQQMNGSGTYSRHPTHGPASQHAPKKKENSHSSPSPPWETPENIEQVMNYVTIPRAVSPLSSEDRSDVEKTAPCPRVAPPMSQAPKYITHEDELYLVLDSKLTPGDASP